MIAGLSTQVASMTAFVFVCSQLAWAVRKHPERLNMDYQEMRHSRRFRFFLWCEYHSPPPISSSYIIVSTH